MGVSNAIDTMVSVDEGAQEFVEHTLQAFDLFHNIDNGDRLMFAQELERYPPFHVFKAGLPSRLKSSAKLHRDN
jgi:hypothetical protein